MADAVILSNQWFSLPEKVEEQEKSKQGPEKIERKSRL